MEWFSALDIAKIRNHRKIQCKCLPISRIEIMTRKLNKTSNRICKELTLRKEEVGGRGHHV
jgi:hypothetical protein